MLSCFDINEEKIEILNVSALENCFPRHPHTPSKYEKAGEGETHPPPLHFEFIKICKKKWPFLLFFILEVTGNFDQLIFLSDT